MKRTLVGLAVAVSLGLWVASARSGDEEHEHEGHEGHAHKHGDHEAGEHMPVPLSPEHKRLREFVGTWKVEHKMRHAPDSEPVVSHGTEVVKPVLDGRGLSVAYESTGPEGPYKGVGLMTWNMGKQKYQSVWLSIYSYFGPDMSWGTYDEESRTWEWEMAMTGPDGKKIPARGVSTSPSKNTKIFTFYTSDEDGEEFEMMEFTYTRAK